MDQKENRIFLFQKKQHESHQEKQLNCILCYPLGNSTEEFVRFWDYMKINHGVIICNGTTQYAFGEIVKSNEENKQKEMMQIVVQSIIYEQPEQIDGKLEEHMNELMEVMKKRNNFKGEGQREEKDEKKKDNKTEDERGKEREQLKEAMSSKRNSGSSSHRERSPTQGRNRSGHSRNNSKNSNRSWTPIENTKTSKEAESQGSTMTSNEQKSKLESQSESENDINTTDTPIIRTSKVETSEEEGEEQKAIGNFNKSIEEEEEEQKDTGNLSDNNDFEFGNWTNYTNRRPRTTYFREDYWNNNNTMEDTQKAWIEALERMGGRNPIPVTAFKGTVEEDPNEWLRNYNNTAKAYGWNDKIKLEAVILYLKGSALDWFEEMQETIGGGKKLKMLKEM